MVGIDHSIKDKVSVIQLVSKVTTISANPWYLELPNNLQNATIILQDHIRRAVLPKRAIPLHLFLFYLILEQVLNRNTLFRLYRCKDRVMV